MAKVKPSVDEQIAKLKAKLEDALADAKAADEARTHNYHQVLATGKANTELREQLNNVKMQLVEANHIIDRMKTVGVEAVKLQAERVKLDEKINDQEQELRIAARLLEVETHRRDEDIKELYEIVKRERTNNDLLTLALSRISNRC